MQFRFRLSNLIKAQQKVLSEMLTTHRKANNTNRHISLTLHRKNFALKKKTFKMKYTISVKHFNASYINTMTTKKI